MEQSQGILIKEKFISMASGIEIPESKALAPDVDTVVSSVCEHYNVTPKELLSSKRGTENIAKDVAIYLVQRLCCKTLPNIGTEFGIKNYSTVSSVVQRMKRWIEHNRSLHRELRIIEERVMKSQKRI